MSAKKKTDLAGTKSVGEEIYFQVNYIMRNGGIKMQKLALVIALMAIAINLYLILKDCFPKK